MEDWQMNLIWLTIAIALVLLNGFFVAAEFALVKVRGSQLDELVKQGRPFSKTARWLGDRMDASLSACQLGITMASLALGWVGEPAFAKLLEPLFHAIGIESQAVLHTTGFITAFTIITALHLVIGEQAPKIYSIRKPELMVLWCAAPLKFFYVLFFPFLIALSFTTSKLLRLVGIEGSSDHDTPHTEDEIRALVIQSHGHGELTPSESRLIHAVFEFDDMICRRVMVPRSDAVFFDVDQSLAECLEIVQHSQHTRYPLCEDSLEHVIGIIHIKDLVGLDASSQIDLRELARKSHHVPETMPISQLLRHFQKTHQLMAMVVDEHGTIVGVVTLENVLEQIIGPVEDEFDTEPPDIIPDGDGNYIVQGSAPLSVVNTKFGLDLDAVVVDTMAGIMLERVGRVLELGDRAEFDGIVAEVIEVDGARAKRIRVTLPESAPDSKKSTSEQKHPPS
jgi:CBS domain containing-hemolysin-like protein